jgi:hypothetical protein
MAIAFKNKRHFEPLKIHNHKILWAPIFDFHHFLFWCACAAEAAF